MLRWNISGLIDCSGLAWSSSLYFSNEISCCASVILERMLKKYPKELSLFLEKKSLRGKAIKLLEEAFKEITVKSRRAFLRIL